MSKWKIAAILFAVAAVALSLLNASWLAPRRKGKLILVAHRGIGQAFDPDKAAADGCTARAIKAPEHNFIANTLFSMQHAARTGADAIALDVRPTSDGRMVVFQDETLDCRTDGKGPVRGRTLDELKKLDVGYGYTADAGRTFPLRGRGIGGMLAVEDVLQRVASSELIFAFTGNDPREADLLFAAFSRAGVKPDKRHAFYGDPAVVARMRALAPEAWTFSRPEAETCLHDYMLTGWSGIVPASCRNTTVAVPLNYQWAVWGWPNRFLDRMAGAGTKVIMLGDYEDGVVAGIEHPEQLGDVPRDFRGHLWVEDFDAVGRALQR
jgi:glycerophosphoryl diester phosphodiesterase